MSGIHSLQRGGDFFLMAKWAGWQARAEAVRNDYVHTHFSPGAGGRSRGAVRDLVGRPADGARHAAGRW